MSNAPIHAAYKSLISSGRITQNTGQAALVKRLATLQNNLTESSTPQNGVYIYGSVGTGKSRVADLFAETMPPGVSTRRIHFYEFMMDIHSRLHRANSQATYRGDPVVQIGRDVRNESRVLCFDEFQVTDIATALILKRLFRAFWQSGGAMVSTSNRHPTSLYEKGRNRFLFLPFIDELQQRCDVWRMEGDQDYRMSTASNEHERQPVFFTNEEEFLESLSLAMGGASLETITIPVMMGRTLNVKGTTIGDSITVHGSFASLCESNVGSADYHALCKVASTIYISGLRQFSDEELDFVRRFITLIDLAYESKTRIICLSEAPLFEVFASIVPPEEAAAELQKAMEEMTVRGEGGSSSSMMTTFIGEVEWSATGLKSVSLATGGAGETDARFAVGRAVSRLFEMGSKAYGNAKVY
ncbi:AFG1-like ATPase [Mytilinidion resinicola]|uniref:AFG1-like ATPase n=1 Tax=Mytilinidion resinicola TaxID=574789 RepID=A0A6A6YX27_9PEZI|nr:AFG1-like ATPase [Mytilinidion resinicola]KAF2813108.1 AFG1-like ATPase [Mytilinidion resinicola]